MSKDIKKALEHCVEWDCGNCPNRDELGSGETVCRGRLLPEVLEYVSDLEAKLAEKDEEIAYLTKQVKKFNNEAQKYFEDAYCNDFHNQDKISFALEQLEQIRKEFEIKFKGCKWEDKMLVGKFCNITNETIDNQIKTIKEMK